MRSISGHYYGVTEDQTDPQQGLQNIFHGGPPLCAFREMLPVPLYLPYLTIPEMDLFSNCFLSVRVYPG
jgi:hypothetical protein